ncbi:hypothetical protein ONZ45_g17755 [Pleurotus djamor]|nr:hypothetical protein ONZ45_g17755 [Pleurotus djamor]
MSNPPSTYENWTREQLIDRLNQLDDSQNQNPKPQQDLKTKQVSKAFAFSAYPTQKIALKFCYSGWEYNGLAHQLGPTPLPTVEATLFDALVQARLVDGDAGFDGCGFERCGRTDRGVSAAGQVVSLWVRAPGKPKTTDEGPPRSAIDDEGEDMDGLVQTSNTSVARTSSAPPINYLTLLNRLLPQTIRILAWSPIDASFSARFNCKHRHYKYFFSSASLDIPQMRKAASLLLGEHDFRNLCKLDPAKQITSFKRRILRADISLVSDSVYVFDLIGTAFLYHQVRHIMAVLFLVGAKLEDPSVMSALLNVSPDAEPSSPPLPIVDRKPEYQMADGLPLMLWDCAYSEDDISWRTDASTPTPSSASTSAADSVAHETLITQLDKILERSTTHNVLDSHFLAAAKAYSSSNTNNNAAGTTIPLGGGTYKRLTKYVPLLERKRLESVDVVNERWRVGKGMRREAKKAADE